MEEGLPFEELENNIDGVLGLIDSFEAEDVRLMFCIELPEDSKLVDQTFLSVLGSHYRLLEEGFHCEFSVVGESLCLVDGSEISLPEFPNWLEHLVKSLLVHSLPQNCSPFLSIAILEQHPKFSPLIVIESHSDFGGLNLFLNLMICTSWR